MSPCRLCSLSMQAYQSVLEGFPELQDKCLIRPSLTDAQREYTWSKITIFLKTKCYILFHFSQNSTKGWIGNWSYVSYMNLAFCLVSVFGGVVIAFNLLYWPFIVCCDIVCWLYLHIYWCVYISFDTGIGRAWTPGLFVMHKSITCLPAIHSESTVLLTHFIYPI